MDDGIRISRAARELGVSPHYLRLLEWEGRVPAVHRDYSGRLYTPFDICLLKALGVGSRPGRLKSAEEVLGVNS